MKSKEEIMEYKKMTRRVYGSLTGVIAGLFFLGGGFSYSLSDFDKPRPEIMQIYENQRYVKGALERTLIELGKISPPIKNIESYSVRTNQTSLELTERMQSIEPEYNQVLKSYNEKKDEKNTFGFGIMCLGAILSISSMFCLIDLMDKYP